MAPPAVHGCFCAGRLCAGQKRCSGFGRGAPIGAAVRAGNDIRADGVASLAPILIQMPQLASLSLAGTLHALVALELWRMVASSGCAWMWVHAVSSSACVNQAVERGRRAEGRWGCAGNHIGATGVALLGPDHFGRLARGPYCNGCFLL